VVEGNDLSSNEKDEMNKTLVIMIMKTVCAVILCLQVTHQG
jgi:hypothetical protein